MKEQDKSLKEKCQLFVETLQLLTVDPVLLARLKRKIFASGDFKRNVFAENLITRAKISEVIKNR